MSWSLVRHDYAIFEDIFWPQKGGEVAVSLQLFYMKTLYVLQMGRTCI